MKLLLLNQDWCADEFRASGHDVRVVRVGETDTGVSIPPMIHVDQITDFLDGFRPDRIVVFDNSSPLMVRGFDTTNTPSVFYAVDTHHHFEMYRYLTHLFEHTFVAQKDTIPAINSGGVPVEWLPLYLSRPVNPTSERRYGAVFVGNLDPALNPDRVAFFSALAKEVPILLSRGAWWEIFPLAQVVVNQTVKGDLNFRVFEAMGCGVPLLTEGSGNGLYELFRDHEELLSYNKGDVHGCAEKIRWVLAHPEEAADIGRRGREAVLRGHTLAHRAEKILSVVLPLERRTSHPLRHAAAAMNCGVFARRLAGSDAAVALRALEEWREAAHRSLAANELLPDDLSCLFAVCAHVHDRWFSHSLGHEFLVAWTERFPEQRIALLALIRSLLNRGSEAEATRYARMVADGSPRFVFEKAEELMVRLLEELWERPQRGSEAG